MPALMRRSYPESQISARAGLKLDSNVVSNIANLHHAAIAIKSVSVRVAGNYGTINGQREFD